MHYKKLGGISMANIFKRVAMIWLLFMLILIVLGTITDTQSAIIGYITIACIGIWAVITCWQHKNKNKIFEQQTLKFKEEYEKQKIANESYIQRLEKNVQDLQEQVMQADETMEQQVNAKFEEKWKEQQMENDLYIQQLECDVQNFKSQLGQLHIFEKSLSDLVERMPGEIYERYVGYKLTKIGWKNIEYTPVTKDYGADIISENPKGEIVCIQCKRYSDPVGISAVQEVYAAKGYYGCAGAMVVTTSTFTQAARELAKRNAVELLENFK